MAYLNRFVIDVKTEEPLPDRKLSAVAKELSDHMHILGLETEDKVVEVDDKLHMAHVHDGTERCGTCEYHSLDNRNADTVT